MTKRALSAVAGFFSLCLPLFAQQTYRSDVFSMLNNSLLPFPSLILSDGQFFSFSGATDLSSNWLGMATADFLPALPTTAPQRTDASSVASPKDSSKEVVEVRRNLLDYVHGEVGVLYGRSSGKFGGAVEQGYIIGEVGDDKFHITAGAAYENSSVRFPRLSR